MNENKPTTVTMNGKEFDIIKRWERNDMRGYIDLRIFPRRIQTGWICKCGFCTIRCLIYNINPDKSDRPGKEACRYDAYPPGERIPNFEKFFGEITND